MANKLTYISLFSSAGVGCFGFKQNGFECIATNELIERRLNIQKINKKCKYESGYICGDITKVDTKEQLYDEIYFWKNKEKINDVDVVIATPPCQGMSVANHKKNSDDIKRNSLVIESINIINTIKPKFFIFENVPAFMKTICTDVDGNNKSIEEAIQMHLGDSYNYFSQILNFKNYGGNSSRTRTLVIGVRKDFSSFISPIDLFPSFKSEKTLRETIGHLPSLKNPYDFMPEDIYHNFRYYDPLMRSWISNLKEGQSAFDNDILENRPHHIVNGVRVENVKKNGDKYTRQYWDKVGACIHTRNDQLASQNTIHPVDDRVFSIRELMELMTIPYEFKWSSVSLEDLNKMSREEKIRFMKKEEINIRQSIGEAVPTGVFKEIAKNIKEFIGKKNLTMREIVELIDDNKLYENGNIVTFVKNNFDSFNYSTLCKIIEYSNAKRNEQSAFYTDKFLVDTIINYLPEFEKEVLHILEPSVGAGNFIPSIIKKYSNKEIYFDLVDIDETAIETLKVITKKLKTTRIHFNLINSDFLKYNFTKKYDLVIGNPPFTKISKKDKFDLDIKLFDNLASNNLASYFIEKSCKIGDYVSMIMPKNLLNTPEYKDTRKYLRGLKIDSIIDFGENGFKGVLVETICLNISTNEKPSSTLIKSITLKKEMSQKQSYIFDEKMPYWILYRNEYFDKFYNQMTFDIFNVFRDRQITSSILLDSVESNNVRVIKSRNISDNGKTIIDIAGYDGYVSIDKLKSLEVAKYIDRDDVFLTPNMTYKTRVMKKEKGYIVNGSVAILILNKDIDIMEEDLLFFSSDDYRGFMQIARNYQTRSLNIDSNSVYFFGIRNNMGGSNYEMVNHKRS